MNPTSPKFIDHLKNRRGFSLTELLVVLSVISVLASLLLPLLGQARQKARQIKCLGQLRQMGMATFMYWEDNSDQLFPYRTSTAEPGNLYWFGWLGRGDEGTRDYISEAGYLFPYINKGSISLCPSFPRQSDVVKWKAKGATFGYGYNLFMGQAASERSATSSEITLPSTCALFVDAAQVNTFQHPASPSNPLLEEFYYFNHLEKTTHFRHELNANTVFVDGHAAALKAHKNSLESRLPREWLGHLDKVYVAPFD